MRGTRCNKETHKRTERHIKGDTSGGMQGDECEEKEGEKKTHVKAYC